MARHCYLGSSRRQAVSSRNELKNPSSRASLPTRARCGWRRPGLCRIRLMSTIMTAFPPSFARLAFLTGLFGAGLLPVVAQPAKDTGVNTNPPVIISAGSEWIPLRTELEIEPGSALDFSHLGFSEAPAGKHGRVIARPDGQFAFADSPKQIRRFYGVNLCFSAQYLAKEQGTHRRHYHREYGRI